MQAFIASFGSIVTEEQKLLIDQARAMPDAPSEPAQISAEAVQSLAKAAAAEASSSTTLKKVNTGGRFDKKAAKDKPVPPKADGELAKATATATPLKDLIKATGHSASVVVK